VVFSKALLTYGPNGEGDDDNDDDGDDNVDDDGEDEYYVVPMW
jgi:hypothetical protein